MEYILHPPGSANLNELYIASLKLKCRDVSRTRTSRTLLIVDLTMAKMQVDDEYIYG